MAAALVELEFRGVVIRPAHGLPGIELRHLVAFKAVADAGSFASAARRLGYTQSAVSQQIAMLEQTLGVTLLIRPAGRGRTTPTAHGELLIRHVTKILAQLQAAESDLAALSTGDAGSVRVGISRNLGALLLPAILRQFLVDWPRIDVQLSEAMYDRQLAAGLATGELDLAFVLEPIDGRFETRELFRDPHVLVGPLDTPLAALDTLTPEDLAGVHLIAYHEDFYGVEASLRAHGVDPMVVFRSDDSAILQALAASGIGSAILPRLAIDPADSDTVKIPLTGLAPRIARLAWHRERYLTPATKALIEVISDCTRTLTTRPDTR